jgi:cytochrome oxidase Cu insertion factor (SCO1/SenC/PrrC family)
MAQGSSLGARALLALTALAACLLAGSCGEGPVVVGAGSSGPRVDPQPDDPLEFGSLPDFRLVSAQGAEVTLASLRGRPLVIGALYSTCTGPCPSIARGMEWLQDELAGTDVLLVVVSVDPEVDSPEVLARYGERMGADPERWIFLTGAEDAVHALVRGGFALAVAKAPEDVGEDVPPGESFTHDVRLLAVDRAGRRRGWYTGTDEVQLERLKRRMLFLASEQG